MLCFKVSINGHVVCIAGLQAASSLSVGIRRDQEGYSRDRKDPYIVVGGHRFNIDFDSGVFGTSRKGEAETVLFGTQNLRLSDTVTVELIESEEPDSPIQIQTEKFGQRQEKLDSEHTGYMGIDDLAATLTKRPTEDEVTSPGIDASTCKRKDQATDPDVPVLLYCSFCGKSQHEVKKLIAGPSTFICDECVELCNEIIEEEVEGKKPGKPEQEELEDEAAVPRKGLWPRSQE